jgi:PAS domain S-box-containing protein
VTVSDTKIENQLLLEIGELNRRITLQEETSLEKEKAGKALQDSEKRYRRLFESAKDGILILDADTGKVVDVNPFLTRLLGYSYDNLCGKHIWEIGVFKDIAASKEAFQTLRDHEYIRYEDMPLRTHYGHPVDVEFVSNVYQVDNNSVIQCNIRDITERKRAEVRIKKGFQLESALLRIDTQILDGADTREVMGTVCEAIVEMGYRMCWIGQPDPERIVRPVAYKGFTDGYPENIDIRWNDSPEEKGPTEIAIRSGQPCVIQSIRESPVFGPWRERAIGHGYLSMAAFPLKSEKGEVIGILDVYSDREWVFGDEEVGRLGMFAKQCSIAVMNARRIETLRDANQRLAFHVTRMPLAYIVSDLGSGVVEWNPAAERIFGWKANEAIGKRAYEFIVPVEERLHSKLIWSKLLEGEELNYSLNANVRKDGKIITCEWFNALLRDASGNVSGVLSMVHDVTEKAELERQLRTAQRMEAVGTLAGGIAHDFNNALTGVTGFAELLKMKLEGNERALSDLYEIFRGAERASVLTRQLLTFARRQIIELVNLDLNIVIANLLKLVSKIVGEHLEIRTILAKTLPTIRADVGQIEQVVMNLVLNARDAMPGGGQIMIETGLVDLNAETVRRYPYMKVGSYVVLAVSDTGVGMDRKTQERVFEPFFTTKEPEKRTGLGLAMVYGIVKQHNGFIHLYSEPGKGTTFMLYFPPVEASPDVGISPGPLEIRGGEETVLLVEDDEPARKLMEQTLMNLGYTVLVARDGEEAVDLFRKNRDRIDLAILDVVMPRKGGKEAYEEMHEVKTDLKAIFVSGYTANAVHESFVLIAGIPFLSKPFGVGVLARKVREVLDKA